MSKKDLCEGGLEHEIVDCPNCSYQFCSSCGIGERIIMKVSEKKLQKEKSK